MAVRDDSTPLNLSEVERFMRASLKSYYANPRYEDGLQEGLIRAWKDIKEGTKERKHILNRALQWTRAYIQKTHARPTGAPPLTRDGIGTAEGDRKLEKVRMWVDEYQRIHEKNPTNVEVANGTGITRHRVQNIRQKLREGKYNHAHYREDSEGHRRLAESYFSEVHIEALAQSRDGSHEDAARVELLEDPHHVDEEVVSRVDFESLLKKVEDPDMRYTLYLRFVLGYTVTEIGEYFATSKHPKTDGARRLKKAVTTIREIIDPGSALNKVRSPYEGNCNNGHPRSPENTSITMKDGKEIRRCKVCVREYKRNHTVRKTEQPGYVNPQRAKTHCKNGHLIDGERKNGTRFCRTCNYEGNLRRKREKAKK